MYKFEQAIAKGSYGQISKIEKDDEFYAVKEFIISKRTKNYFGALYLKEVDFLKRCDHPNIVRIISISYSNPYEGGTKLYYEGVQDHVFVIMHLAEMSCSDFIQCDDDDFTVTTPATVPLLKRFMYQIASGLAYLHSHKICNRDIKSPNVLIFKDEKYSDAYNAVICDLGMCKTMTDNMANSDHIGTSSYKSPEVLLGYVDYSYSIDIWSLGILFFELFNLYLPFERQRSVGAMGKSKLAHGEIITKIFKNRGSLTLKKFNQLSRNGNSVIDFSKISQWSKKSISKLYNKKSKFFRDFEEVSENLPNFGTLEEYTDLLEHCLEVDYKERWNIYQILEHPFFKDIPENTDRNSSEKKRHLDMWRGLHKIPLEVPEYHILEKTSNNEKRLKGLEIIEKTSVTYYDVAPRILFLGLDIYDRCLLHVERNGEEIDEILLAYTSIYLSAKYFLDESIPKFSVIFPGKENLQNDPDFTQSLVEMEKRILVEILEWKIYRPTIYDLLQIKSRVSGTLFSFLKKKEKAYGHKIDKLAKIFEEIVHSSK